MKYETGLALADMLKKLREEYRVRVAPGKYEVDETLRVRVRARMNVGEDFNSHIVAKAQPWALVGVLLAELEEARAAARLEAVDLDALVRASLAVTPDLADAAKARADKIVAALKAETITTVAGRVTMSMNLVEIEEVP